MFQRLGICWHTGYKYTHYKTQEEADNDLPAIKRMKKALPALEDRCKKMGI